jgi:hypothetical protein
MRTKLNPLRPASTALQSRDSLTLNSYNRHLVSDHRRTVCQNRVVSGSVHIHIHARKPGALSTKMVPARGVCGNELHKTRIDPGADMEQTRVDTAQVGSL